MLEPWGPHPHGRTLTRRLTTLFVGTTYFDGHPIPKGEGVKDEETIMSLRSRKAGLGIDDSNIRKVSVFLIDVEAIANYEAIRDLEPHIVDRNVHFSP